MDVLDVAVPAACYSENTTVAAVVSDVRAVLAHASERSRVDAGGSDG
jgi:hypothetical protein